MTDATSTTTTATPETPTPPTPSANSAEARNADGSLKDLALGTKPDADPTKPAEPNKEPSEVSKDGKTPAVPEAYTFKAPEGYTLDEKLIAEATPIFKEMGLSQDAAQRLVDWYSRTQIANNKAIDDTVTKMRNEWRDTVAKDPEIGGKLDAVKANIGKALASVNDPKLVADFKSAMDLTGGGDHPAIIKVLNKWAEAVNEGTAVSGKGPSNLGQLAPGQTAKPSPAAALYPTLPH